ncbi:MAG: alpha-E domain-containing protein [Verrucomicrobiota bacterium]
MLSRVANNLYWMARYIERAENLARLINTHEQDLMDLVWSGDDTAKSWRSMLEVTALEELYAEQAKGKKRKQPIADFMSISPKNPESIVSCIAAARENARAVRDQISEEVWLNLNGLHIFLRDNGRQEWRKSAPDFCSKIIESSLLFHGITDATIPHEEAWAFIQLGKYIERADKTTRILDFPHFLPEGNRGAAWPTVMRACSAASVYRARFGGEVTASKASAILIFSSTFPRSVRFCMRQVHTILHSISSTPTHRYSNEAERLAGATLARLDFAGRNEVAELGLHQYVDSLQVDLNAIGLEIYSKYFFIREREPLDPKSKSQSQSQSQSTKTT